MHTPSAVDRFQHQTYVIRRQFFKLFGGAFRVYDPSGQLAFYSQQKAFKLKEDIRIYADETQAEEVLSIRARSWLDFAAAYDVVDPSSGEKVGALKRKGFKSMVQDEWVIMDANDRDVGLVREDNALLALVRRFVPFAEFIPQKFLGSISGQPVCEFRQHFNPIIQKITLNFSPDVTGLLDRRLGLAAGILLVAIEERQDGGLSLDV